MSIKQVNIGILGVGSLVTKQHLPNAYNNPAIKIHTLCDINRERLEKYQKQYDPQKVTTDYREMINDPEIDIVVIAVEPQMHGDLTINALRSGKHVYVEKPLAEKTSVAVEVAKVAAEMGKHVAVGFNRRFAPSYRDVYELVACDSGPILITYRMFDDERDRPSWYEGRPRLLDEACHVFDVFNWLANSEPVSVFATEYGRAGDNVVIVKYENGVTATLAMSSFGSFHWPKERLEVVGDNKVIAVEDFVELQAGGVEGVQQKNYAGCEYNGFSKGYSPLYQQLGLPFYRAMRRLSGDLLLNSSLINQETQRDKWEVVGGAFPDQIRIPINYSCDKGWYNSLDSFVCAVRDNVVPGNATALDAVKVLAISLAAIESVKKGVLIHLDQNVWAVTKKIINSKIQKIKGAAGKNSQDPTRKLFPAALQSNIPDAS